MCNALKAYSLLTVYGKIDILILFHFTNGAPENHGKHLRNAQPHS